MSLPKPAERRAPIFVAPAFLFFLCGLPALEQGTPPEDNARPSASASSDYIIGVEDTLAISVWKEPELTQAGVVVRPDGKISFPLVGDLQAAGKTPRQLAQTLTESLARYIKEPIVTVIVQQINNFKVYVIGEVGHQGELALKRRTRLLQAVALAGGLSPYANKTIVVVRDEAGRDVRTEIDYRKVLSGERPEQNIYLKPGDTIIVQ